LVTLEGSAIDPHAEDVRRIYAACGEAGVGAIKPGYWLWKPGDDYWHTVESIRRALDTFQQLGEQYGIRSLLHTHSGLHYFSNASGVMHAVRGFDPHYIGVYLDPGHLAADGESLPLALAIVQPCLQMIGVKNVRYVEEKPGRGWVNEWCPLAQGLVDWDAAVSILREVPYGGPLSLHDEYSGEHEKAGALRLAAADVYYLRSILAVADTAT
jgi:sugar phosphate isomerase/epimerase